MRKAGSLFRDRSARVSPIGRTVGGLADAIDALSPVLLASLFALALASIFAFVPWGQNADDLLPTLISTQKLTFYFWEQNRFANLLPLLTAWIDSPVRNAETQLFLRVLTGLIAPAFFCVLYYPRLSQVCRATLAADCLMLLAASPAVLHETYIVATPYGTSLACGAAGMALSRRGWSQAGWRRRLLEASGAAFLLAAHLVNYGLGLFAIPLLAVLAVMTPSPAANRFLVLNLFAAIGAFVAPSVFAPMYFTRLGLSPSLDGMLSFGASIWMGTGPAFWVCVIGPLAVVAAVFIGTGRGRSGKLFGVFAGATGAAVLFGFLLASSSQHVALNEFNIRYFVPALLALLALAGIACWEAVRLIASAPGGRSALMVVLSGLALMLAAGRLAASGGPTADIIKPESADVAHAVAARVTALNLDGITGNYWQVWPSVFAAEQERIDAGRVGTSVIGITQRGEVRRDVFLARLHAQGGLRLGCVDFVEARCLEEVKVVMTPPQIRIRSFAPDEPLPGGHMLRFVEIVPGG